MSTHMLPRDTTSYVHARCCCGAAGAGSGRLPGPPSAWMSAQQTAVLGCARARPWGGALQPACSGSAGTCVGHVRVRHCPNVRVWCWGTGGCGWLEGVLTSGQEGASGRLAQRKCLRLVRGRCAGWQAVGASPHVAIPSAQLPFYTSRDGKQKAFCG